MKPSYRMEPLSETLQVCVSPEHGFGTDAFLLTDFSRYRRKDLVCDLGTGCGIIPMISGRIRPNRCMEWTSSHKPLSSFSNRYRQAAFRM